MFCNTVISRPVISANETNRGGFLLCSGAAAGQRSSAAAALPRPPDNLSASLEIHQINILHGWRGGTGGALVEAGNRRHLWSDVPAGCVLIGPCDQAPGPSAPCWTEELDQLVSTDGTSGSIWFPNTAVCTRTSPISVNNRRLLLAFA